VIKDFFEKGFLYLAIGSAILLPFSIVLYTLREKRAVAIKRRAETNPKLIRILKRQVTNFHFLLWLSPIYLIFVPWAMSKYLDINGIIIFASIALLFVNIFIQYIHNKWLYQYLTKSDIA
jgi:hypothetical protein